MLCLPLSHIIFPTRYQFKTFATGDTYAVLSHHVNINLPDHFAPDRGLGPVISFVDSPEYRHVRDWDDIHENVHVFPKPANGAV